MNLPATKVCRGIQQAFISNGIHLYQRGGLTLALCYPAAPVLGTAVRSVWLPIEVGAAVKLIEYQAYFNPPNNLLL